MLFSEINAAAYNNTFIRQYSLIGRMPKALPSITADAIFLLPVRRKWQPNVHGLSLWRRLFSIAAYDGGNFRISRQNQSSPGKTRLTRYKRRHISTSGTAQMAAERARLEPMEKCVSSIAAYDGGNFRISWQISHLSAQP